MFNMKLPEPAKITDAEIQTARSFARERCRAKFIYAILRSEGMEMSTDQIFTIADELANLAYPEWR